jgi:hypothetical protein
VDIALSDTAPAFIAAQLVGMAWGGRSWSLALATMKSPQPDHGQWSLGVAR